MRKHDHATAKVLAAVHTQRQSLWHRVQNCKPADFNNLALDIFAYQAAHNPIYRAYLKLLGIAVKSIKYYSNIPCAPISFFRHHDLRTSQWDAETYFQSSGTTAQLSSKHYIRDLAGYKSLSINTFERLCGQLQQYQCLALLPNYLQQGHSGLVAMVDGFMDQTHPQSGFYLDDIDALQSQLHSAFAKTQAILLWGVTYALLDLAEQGTTVLPKGSMLMETGGMKGRREELTRQQVHTILHARFKFESGEPVPVCSEYGMTELSSQAYYTGANTFTPAHTMRVQIRDITDPFTKAQQGKSGAINVIDLANLDTLAFIQTDDLGVVHPDGITFDVRGRADASIVRGCNLMVSDL